MDRAYRAGQVVNVWLIGVLCGVTLYAVLRHAELNEREYRTRRLPHRQLASYIDIGCSVPRIGEVEE